jgi:hypothetical protein
MLETLSRKCVKESVRENGLGMSYIYCMGWDVNCYIAFKRQLVEIMLNYGETFTCSGFCCIVKKVFVCSLSFVNCLDILLEL